MKAGQILSKTMPYVWAKLFLGLAIIIISAALFGLLVGLSTLFDSNSLSGVMILIWLILTIIIRAIIVHYVGYLFKAGHIAVMTEAVVSGRVPDHQLAYGKRKIVERFGTTNVYFVIDKLVAGAVKQIQNGIGKLGNALSFVPGMGVATSMMKSFVGISLGYIDECCLGYTFLMQEQGAFKSAADGVVIYAQNWKQLLGNAAKTMFLVVLGSAAIILGVFVVLMLLFRVIGWPAWVAFFISVFMAFTLKSAFIDSFILARTMVAYMNVAPTTVITFDLYGKLSKVSAKFKQLWSKGQEEDPSPQPGAPAYAGAGYGAQPGAPAYAGAGYGAQPGAPAYAGAGYGAQPGAPAYAGAGYGAQPGAPAYAGAGYGAQPGAPAYAGAGYGVQPGAPAYAGAGYGVQPAGPAYAGAGYGAQPAGPAYAGMGYGAQPAGPAYAGTGYGAQPATQHVPYGSPSINAVYCRQCNALNAQGGKHCSSCGAPL